MTDATRRYLTRSFDAQLKNKAEGMPVFKVK